MVNKRSGTHIFNSRSCIVEEVSGVLVSSLLSILSPSFSRNLEAAALLLERMRRAGDLGRESSVSVMEMMGMASPRFATEEDFGVSMVLGEVSVRFIRELAWRTGGLLVTQVQGTLDAGQATLILARAHIA